MAFLPVLLDMADEIYAGLDGQSKTFAESFPMFFVPQMAQATPNDQSQRCPRGQPRFCRFQRGEGVARKCRGGACTKPASEEFEVSFDVKSFKPEEITVKVKAQEIIIEGKHEEREDKLGFVTQQFSRRFILPEEFDADTVSTFLNTEGKMTIKAQKPLPAAIETNERIIPIQHIASSPIEQEQGWEKVEEQKTDTEEKKENE